MARVRSMVKGPVPENVTAYQDIRVTMVSVKFRW